MGKKIKDYSDKELKELLYLNARLTNRQNATNVIFKELYDRFSKTK